MRFECADAASLQASSDMVITLGDDVVHHRDDSAFVVVDDDIVEREDVNRNVVRTRSGRRPLWRGVANTTMLFQCNDGQTSGMIPTNTCKSMPPHLILNRRTHNLSIVAVTMWTKRSINSAALLVVAMAASMSGVVESFPMHAVYRSIRYNQSQSNFSERSNNEEEDLPNKKGFFANFFQELDAFVDDATSRRLGNGAQYYGKRKSSFYGADDSNKKRDSVVFDPTEDYWAANGAGYFKWVPDEETGELKPVTRMKEKVIEKPKVR